MITAAERAEEDDEFGRATLSSREGLRSAAQLARILSSRETPIAILQSNPAAWEIVNKHIPGMDRRIGNEMIKPHLGNFSLESLLVFGVVQREPLARIDAELAKLGEVQ
ncbi:hypothetical protein [Novosphingobium sp.]|uniref:hypothetical protein n=1 Tax=Novosphingobium sp. TaxID=1874826 RepID=UPI0028A5E0C7|nr:hypothetical protein [Novosphingobium sp.]